MTTANAEAIERAVAALPPDVQQRLLDDCAPIWKRMQAAAALAESVDPEDVERARVDCAAQFEELRAVHRRFGIPEPRLAAAAPPASELRANGRTLAAGVQSAEGPHRGIRSGAEGAAALKRIRDEEAARVPDGETGARGERPRRMRRHAR